jgi:pimeloyl-ACP methyl ester carboxylesterase
LSALLVANPRNLLPKEALERRPDSPALGRLAQITAPTVIVTGEHDIADVHAHSGAIAAGIVGSRRLVLSNCAHMPHFEIPEAFDRAVLEFLSTNT